MIKARNINLTEGPVALAIIRFSVPILLSNLLQQLYNTVDSAVLGWFAGPEALAAVGSCGALISMLIGFFLGLATGTGVLFAMHYGAGDYLGLKKLIDNAMLLAIAAALVITAVGIGFSVPLLRMMDTPAEIMPPSIDYLRIYMAGTLVNLIYNVGAGIIRAEGDSIRPLGYLAVGGVINLLLDVLMVAWLDMGVAGAAIATVSAQAVTALLVFVRLCRLRAEYAFRPFHMEPDRLVMWDILRVSVPCGLQSAMYNISNLLVQIKINSFGTIAMAGTTAYGKLDAFVYMPVGALALGTSTFVGQNLGACKYARIKKGIRTSLLLTIGVALALAGIIAAFFEPLMHIFTTDPEAIEYGRGFMVWLLPFIWVYSFVDIYSAVVRGSGQAMPVTIISALCICVYRVLWLELLMPVFGDINIVYMVYPISWALCAGTMLWYYYRRSSLHKTILAHPDT